MWGFKDKESQSPTLELVSVVNEFLNVFHKDLPRIPPERKVGFGINLLLDTQLIAIHPYHMGPTELNELKDQLNDLLEKGFITPSTLL